MKRITLIFAALAAFTTIPTASAALENARPEPFGAWIFDLAADIFGLDILRGGATGPVECRTAQTKQAQLDVCTDGTMDLCVSSALGDACASIDAASPRPWCHWPDADVAACVLSLTDWGCCGCISGDSCYYAHCKQEDCPPDEEA